MTDYDVVIAGYGPTGAVLAALLGQHGVRTLAVDPMPDVYPLPRAVHFDDEIMHLFQRMGLAQTMHELVNPVPAYEFRTADGQVLLRYGKGAVKTRSGWQSGYLFHQPSLERAIRACVASQSSVDVRLETRVAGLEQMPDYVLVTLEGTSGQDQVKARYLVAADGGSSPVREMLGIALDDYAFDEPWLVVDALVSDPTRMPNIMLQICDPARPTTCIPIDSNRHRWEFMLLPGETAENVDEAFIKNLLEPWNLAGAIEIERQAVYRFHGLVAKQWRQGRVLLAGDAAHQMPPFAGQGMCSGLRDADNLAWKLDTIVNRNAPDLILDTYQPEREAGVRAYIGLAIGMGQMVCTLDPKVAEQRDAAMLAQRASGSEPLPPPELPPMSGITLSKSTAAGTRFFQPWAGARGLDDVLGSGAWLIARKIKRSDDDQIKTRCIDDPDLAPYRSAINDWLEERNEPAVLVRPDRYVFGTGEVDVLRAAWAEALTV